MTDVSVPFSNLAAQHGPLRAELLAALGDVIDESAFAGGKFVERFESDFAKFCGAPHAIGVGSGTDALWLALRAAGVGPGDEVITVAATFFATAEAISACGATPVFVDIEPDTYTLNPRLIKSAITTRTKAILPVHLYGQMADMDPILEIAKAHGLHVIEDACQAHGATYKGRKAGTIGDLGCFSFYPTKNLGALGEAGAVVTSNRAFADSIKTLRDHGQRTKYYHSEIGWNARLDGIQAAALSVKLRHLPAYNHKRQAHAASYLEKLSETPRVLTPVVGIHRTHTYHLFVVRVPDRDQVISEMADRRIAAAIHYPVPVHQQAAYRSLPTPGPLPITEQLARECLSLPLYPELTTSQIDRVIDVLRAALGARSVAVTA